MAKVKGPQIADAEIALSIGQASVEHDEAPRAAEDLHLERIKREDRALERLENYYNGRSQVEMDLIGEYAAHLHEPDYRQKWDLIPAVRLTKIWSDYVKLGFVRDEKGLDKLADLMVENIQKIAVNNILCGHEQDDPIEFATSITGEGYPEGYFEQLPHFFDDEKGNWRISDYAIKKLIGLAIDILDASSAEDKLQFMDRVLNVVHQRSDLSSWFIEGGRSTLNQLSSVDDEDDHNDQDG
jgi:hypothetical protein